MKLFSDITCDNDEHLANTYTLIIDETLEVDDWFIKVELQFFNLKSENAYIFFIIIYLDNKWKKNFIVFFGKIIFNH